MNRRSFVVPSRSPRPQGKSGFRTSWIASGLAGLVLAAVTLPSARAVDVPVIETNPVMIAGATAQVSMAADIYTLTGYLTGIVGTPPGNGLIALTSAMDGRLAAVGSAVGQIPANQDALDRLREQDLQDIETARRRMPSYAKTSCYDVTMGLSRSGGTTNTAAIKRQIESSVLAEREGYVEDADRQTLVNRALEHSAFCSSQDIANKRPGCKNASVSNLPSADLRSSTLNRAPSSDGAGNDPTSNYTLTQQAQQAAKAYIQNVTPQTLPQPDPVKRLTESNNAYLVNLDRYNARASVITDVLASIAAAHSENWAVVGYNETAQIWRSGTTRDKYRILFPQQTFPEAPSEMEMLRYEVFLQYAEPVTIAARQSMTEKELAVENLKMQALNARLNLLLLERTEGMVKLQAQILAQSLDPMTRGGMAGQLNTSRSSN